MPIQILITRTTKLRVFLQGENLDAVPYILLVLFINQNMTSQLFFHVNCWDLML